MKVCRPEIVNVTGRPMDSRAKPRRLRQVAALLLCSVALLLGGCVYLRLLELKLQLGKFDEYFALQTTDGLTLVFQEPVLRTADIRWIGVKPEQIKTLGHAEQWEVRWVKQLPPGVSEKNIFDITLELGFADGKLTRATIPERYFAVMPKAFLIGVIRSVGHGKIDASSKKIDTAVSAPEVAAVRPKLAAVDQLLGKPSEERVEGDNTIVRYRYVPATKESRVGVFDMHLTFDTKSGELRKWQGFTPVGRIGLDFKAERPKS